MQGTDDKKRLGDEGEALVRAWLIKQDYLILPASLINGMGAPMLLGRKRIILPDNLTWHKDKGTQGWIEVKTKTTCSPHELKPKRDEHGIPLRHWIAYEMIQMQTQTPVSLAVLQIDIESVGLSLIDNLKSGERIYPMDGEQHIFFNKEDFVWYKIKDLPMPKPIKPLAERTVKQLEKRAQGRLFPETWAGSKK